MTLKSWSMFLPVPSFSLYKSMINLYSDELMFYIMTKCTVFAIHILSLVILQKLRHGLLILLRNGVRLRTWPILSCLDILLEDMLLQSMLWRWLCNSRCLSPTFLLIAKSCPTHHVSLVSSQHPEHVQHLILVGPAGFTSETEHKSEFLTKFRATWKGAVANHLWESNFTPQKIIR